MINTIYNLPDINLYGGESETLYFDLRTPSGNIFDARNCTASFALTHYANKNGQPLLVKTTGECDITEDSDGIKSVVRVILNAQDTLKLCGRYVYQLSLYDESEKKYDIPGQGILNVTRNINTAFIK